MRKSRLCGYAATTTGIATGILFCLLGCAIDSLSEMDLLWALMIIGALAGATWFLAKLRDHISCEEARVENIRQRRRERLHRLEDAV